jgi:threonine dehydratase
MVAEGAGAISTGALLDGQLSVTPSSNVVLIISGCNVDLKAHAAAIQPYLQQEDRL